MCGIGGAWGEGAGGIVTRMTPWLMHRGQEGVGYAYLRDGALRVGTPPEDAQAALVHTRYSTSGPYGAALQPVIAKYRDLEIALAFNGTAINYKQLDRDAAFDGEALAKCLAREIWELGLEDGVRETCGRIVGAASFIAITPWGLLAVRDPRGVRPLAVSLEGGAFRAASETVAIRGGTELPPGTALLYGSATKTWRVAPGDLQLCALEYVYFAHPASRLCGRLVADVRRALGVALAEGEREEADVVAYVPETARHIAAGFAERLGLKLADAVVKSRFAGRVFLKPPFQRGAEDAFWVVEEYVRGRRVFLVDDSLIRGTNLRVVVRLLRAAGASKVHVRIASPPIRWPCFYGMDFQSRRELVAWRRSIDEIRAEVGADTLRYISLDAFREVLGRGTCLGCFTGEYPQKIDVEWAERLAARSI